MSRDSRSRSFIEAKSFGGRPRGRGNEMARTLQEPFFLLLPRLRTLPPAEAAESRVREFLAYGRLVGVGLRGCENLLRPFGQRFHIYDRWNPLNADFAFED